MGRNGYGPFLQSLKSKEKSQSQSWSVVELKNPKKEKNKVLRSEKKVAIMFPGMFMRKPDKAVALKQLKSHVAMFGTWVLVIRVTPYILHFLNRENEELKLEL